MSNQKCPLKGLSDTTHPSEVSNIEFIRSEPDQGGCSKNHYLCKVCNHEFMMQEDISYHYPHYYWPAKCVRNDKTSLPA